MGKAFRNAAAALLLIAVPPGSAVAQEEPQLGVEELQSIVETTRAEMFRSGEYVEGWDRGGANPDADVRALGTESHYFQSRGPQGISVVIVTNRPIAGYAPSRWRVVDSYGSAVPDLPNGQVGFIALTPRYAMATQAQVRRVNDADCSDGIDHALLFEVPGAAEREDDEAIPLVFRLLMLAAEDQTVCVRSDGNARDGYRMRAFRPDGRALPELTDADELGVIVPAAPVDRLIEPPPPRPRVQS